MTVKPAQSRSVSFGTGRYARSTVRRSLVVSTAVLALCATLLPACTPKQPPPANCTVQKWVGAWRAVPTNASYPFADQTVRLVLAPHARTRTLRVRLSNRFGTGPLTIDAATVGLRATNASLVHGSARTITFNSQSRVVIPAGGRAISDPVSLSVVPTDQLAVTLYAARATAMATEHLIASEVGAYLAAGNHTRDETAAAFSLPSTNWFFLEGIDVLTQGDTGAVAALGDSIADGYGSRSGQRPGEHNTRYPDFLARRLEGSARHLTVLNMGFSGDGLLAGVPGGLSRVDRDVRGTPGLTDVLILEGINDIGRQAGSATQLIGMLTLAITQLRSMGFHVTVGTLSPGTGFFIGTYGDAQANLIRHAVNAWIRTSGVPNSVVDFDRAIRDPQHPDRLDPRYDSGDHLHPNARAYEAMANAINLLQLRGTGCAPR